MHSEIIVFESDEITVFSDGSVEMQIEKVRMRFYPEEIRKTLGALTLQMGKLGNIRSAGEMLAERAAVMIEAQDQDADVSVSDARRFLEAAIDNWERIWCGFYN